MLHSLSNKKVKALCLFISLFTLITSKKSNATEVKYTDEALEDEILEMPDVEFEIPFRQFSGYLNISDNKRIFYWYVESEQNATSDPLSYWTNGGPGCSGLYGFGTEMGPFLFKNSTIELNPHRWNLISNMLYVEQPAGVGFSYIPNTTFYESNDEQATDDEYELILKFYEKFPHLLENDLYISSESYGGHYMPLLALKILQENDLENFKGFAVGNPWVHPPTDYIECFQMYYYRGVVPFKLYNKWKKLGCSDPQEREHKVACQDYELFFYISMGDQINPYALDYPVCLLDDDDDGDDDDDDSNNDDDNDRTLNGGANVNNLKARGKVHLQSAQAAHLRFLYTDKLSSHYTSAYEPCAEDYFTTYINREDVQDAIHATCYDCISNKNQWGVCSYNLAWPTSDIYSSLVDLYNELATERYNIKMLIFSGDDDGICPTSGTQQWMFEKLAVEAQDDYFWKEWYNHQGQVAGYLTKYDLEKRTGSSLYFATVHGAGHEVPAYKPAEAFILWERFLQDTLMESIESQEHITSSQV